MIVAIFIPLKINRTQTNVGWSTFIFGAPCNDLIKLQHQYLQHKNKKRSGTNWFSNVIKIIWDLQFNLWIHRNTFIHHNNNSIHPSDEDKINKCIQREYNIGILRMDRIYTGLFSIPYNTLLNKNDNYKLQWLHTIWEARDRYTYEYELDPWEKDITVEKYIKIKLTTNKRKWETIYC